MCSLLISPCLPLLLRDLSVPGYLWHLLWMYVCVAVGWGGVVRLQPDLLSHLYGCLSVALWWNRWTPAVLGVSSFSSPCGPVAAKSNLPQQCGNGCIHLLACLTVYLLISSPASSQLAHLSISPPACLFLWLPPYLLSWLSPYYLQYKLRFQPLDESCSYSELWPALHNHCKTKSVVTDFRNINILWGVFQSTIN